MCVLKSTQWLIFKYLQYMFWLIKQNDLLFSLDTTPQSSLQCYSVRSTIVQVLRKNEFENFSILIFDALFITDLWIIPEG